MIVALCPNSYDPQYNTVPLYNEHFLHEIFRPKNRVIEGDYCTLSVLENLLLMKQRKALVSYFFSTQ